MDKLKPCPFCGNEAMFEEYVFDAYSSWVVKCTRCFSETYYEDTKGEAIEAWNRRVGNE